MMVSQNPERDAEILRMHEAKVGPADIASQMGVTDSVVGGVIFRATKRNKNPRIRERHRTHLQNEIDRLIDEVAKQTELVGTVLTTNATVLATNEILIDGNKRLITLITAQTQAFGALAQDFHDALQKIEEISHRHHDAEPVDAEAPMIPVAPIPQRRPYRSRTVRPIPIIDTSRPTGQQITANICGDPPPGRSVADKLGGKA